MSNEHVQHIANLIIKEKERLQNAYLKIETGIVFLSELLLDKHNDSVKVREELLHNFSLLKKLNRSPFVELARAETVNDEDDGDFSLYIGAKGKSKENPSLEVTFFMNPGDSDKERKKLLIPGEEKSPESLANTVMSFIKKEVEEFPITLQSRIDFAEEIAEIMNAENLQKRVLENFINA